MGRKCGLSIEWLAASTTVVVTKKRGLAQLLGIGDAGKAIDELLKTQYMSEFSDRELREK